MNNGRLPIVPNGAEAAVILHVIGLLIGAAQPSAVFVRVFLDVRMIAVLGDMQG